MANSPRFRVQDPYISAQATYKLANGEERKTPFQEAAGAPATGVDTEIYKVIGLYNLLSQSY